MQLRRILLAFSILCYGTFALAQSVTEPNNEYGFELNEFLPNQISGLTDITPFWGVTYGYHYGVGMLEGGLHLANAGGASYYLYSAGYRVDEPVDDKLNGFINFGLNGSYFSTSNHLNKISAFGGYLGGGLLAQAAGPVWIRGGMQFNFGPGIGMMLTLGFMYRK